MGLCQKCWSYFSRRKAKGRFLCEACRVEILNSAFTPLDAIRFMGDLEVQSLFPYSGFLRELCLRVKVGTDVAGLACLFELLDCCPGFQAVVKNIDVILPVPSSLWGRIHGRLDIAGLLASYMCDKFDKTPSCLPWQAYFWRLQKRARQQRPDRIEPGKKLNMFSRFALPSKELLLKPLDLGSLRVLIVDDIATTGLSLQETGEKVRSDDVFYFSLFRSRDRPRRALRANVAP